MSHLLLDNYAEPDALEFHTRVAPNIRVRRLFEVCVYIPTGNGAFIPHCS